MGERIPGPICGSELGPGWLDPGTLCLVESSAPVSTGIWGELGPAAGDTDAYYYSPAFKVAIEVPFSIAPHMTWDAYWRLIYDKTTETLQRQANLLLQRGALTTDEAKRLVDVRNQLLLKIRRRLSPFGELYSELLKPGASLKTFEQFIQEKGSIEAVLKSVGKTRQVVDRIAVVSRVAGPATIVLEIGVTALVIEAASPQDRGRVAAREMGGTAGSIGGGVAGAWAGCAGAATLASPSLVVPIVGEVSTGGACLIGGILGGIGVGLLGRKLGETAGETFHDLYVSDFTWVKR